MYRRIGGCSDFIRCNNGKIALFKRGYSMPVEIFDVNTNSLPQSDRELIIVGVTAYSDEEAQKLVEDYTS